MSTLKLRLEEFDIKYYRKENPMDVFEAVLFCEAIISHFNLDLNFSFPIDLAFLKLIYLH